MVMDSEEGVDLGNYTACVVGPGVGLKILEWAENGSMLKDGICTCGFGLSRCWVQVDKVRTHLLGDVDMIIAMDVSWGDRHAIQ
jgi:hypothetical protein